ncbi:MAG TPA: DUF402 domain-containing protein [Stackebrandtia sp.]|jgi:hypothetical protein|uniref:DUF402 domain-containing protein n=1 Tax=Stackebrandtia sp. TaxID=2023065 RepID=UPI002D47C671|nr:DUF402 domain-containing protein [Stackebrandtia sp.]HZE37947.1 DUF402 domain-containing protein [Stackebrandtia sp.]
MTTRPARKLRPDGTVSMTWREEVLGVDDCGEWAVIRAGSPVHTSRGAAIEYATDQMYCYPRGSWWVAHFWGPDLSVVVREPDGSTWTTATDVATYVDISCPAERDADGVSFVDLYLDVVWANENAEVLDGDEWREVIADGGLSAEWIERGEAACAEVVAAMTARRAPFDGSALGRFRGRQGNLIFNCQYSLTLICGGWLGVR